jgi:hypothetical protein
MGSGLLQQRGEIQKKLRQRLRRQVPQARAAAQRRGYHGRATGVYSRRPAPRLLS